MKRIISSLFLAITVLLVGGAFVSSCSNEILSTQHVDNTPHAFTLKLSAGLGAVQAEELGEVDNPNDTRAGAIDETFSFNYRIIDGAVKMTGDNARPTNVPQKTGQLNRELFIKLHPTVKLLTVVRAKNRKSQVYYDYSEWTYDKLSDLYIKDHLSIPLSAGFQLSDEIEVRLAVGGNMKVSEDGRTCTIGMHDNLYKQINLGDKTATENIEMPIPYVSGWESLEYDGGTSQMVFANDEKKAILKPQGVLFLVTLRNNMEEDLNMSGIRIVSNAIDFEGDFSLGADNIQFTPTYSDAQRIDMRIANDKYRSKEFTFNERLTLKKNPTRNPYDFNHAKVLVIWVMPDGTTGGFNWSNSGPALKTAQTHVYGLDVKDGSGQEVTKPNYRIVPIMGTVNTLTSGKSFTLNCEFYTQPEQVLGYLAKYPVNAQGDGFATSHDDAQTDLVNWKVAKDFINGKDITLPNGQKQNFKMIDLGFSNLLGLGYYYLTYTGSHNYTAISTGVENEPGRLWTANGGPSFGHPLFKADNKGVETPYGRRTMTFIPNRATDNGKYVGYRLIGHGMTGGRDDSKAFLRSPALSVIKYEVEGSNDGNVIHQHLTSIYMGKYWVGNLFTPVYENVALVSRRFWENPINLRNKVERRIPTPGQYAKESLTANDSDSPVPANGRRINVGVRACFWSRNFPNVNTRASFFIMENYGKNPTLTGEEWIDKIHEDFPKLPSSGVTNAAILAGTIPDWGWNISNPAGSNYRDRDLARSFLFQPLLVFSERSYQGDTAD